MSGITTTREPELPDQNAADQAAQAVADLNAFLQAHPTPSAHVRLCTDEKVETQVVIPSLALRFFIEVLAELSNGNTVTVAPVHAELTTQQAADMLNVSRPYLIKVLNQGGLPYRRVGNRRKIQLVDVTEHKRRDDAHRQEILDELTREAEDLGLSAD